MWMKMPSREANPRGLAVSRDSKRAIWCARWSPKGKRSVRIREESPLKRMATSKSLEALAWSKGYMRAIVGLCIERTDTCMPKETRRFLPLGKPRGFRAAVWVRSPTDECCPRQVLSYLHVSGDQTYATSALLQQAEFSSF